MTREDIIKSQRDDAVDRIKSMSNDMAEVRSFLRLINSSEENVLTDEAHAKFVELYDKVLPNG